MNLQKAVKEVLEVLFEGYVNDGGASIYDIGEDTTKHGIPVQELGNYLVGNGLVKDQRFLPTTFMCAISFRGIDSIQPTYFSDLIDNLIISAGITGDWINIMECLPFEQKDFQRAFDVGKVIEASNLAEVRYQGNAIYIKLTISGRERYEKKNSGRFF